MEFHQNIGICFWVKKLKEIIKLIKKLILIENINYYINQSRFWVIKKFNSPDKKIKIF